MMINVLVFVKARGFGLFIDKLSFGELEGINSKRLFFLTAVRRLLNVWTAGESRLSEGKQLNHPDVC